MTICKKCLISGKVQGVFYRASSQQQAEKLALTGYAINLADGSVEILVCGAMKQVEEMCNWLWKGPGGAKVKDVVCEATKEIPPAFFTIA